MENESELLDFSGSWDIVVLIDIRNNKFPISTILGELGLSCIATPSLNYVFPITIARRSAGNKTCVCIALSSANHTFVTFVWIEDNSYFSCVSLLDNSRNSSYLCHCCECKDR